MISTKALSICYTASSYVPSELTLQKQVPTFSCIKREVFDEEVPVIVSFAMPTSTQLSFAIFCPWK